jgi:hypothetical protein
VTRVEISRARSKKGKGALIGAAAGLAVGVGLGLATGDSNCSGSGGWLCFNREETSVIWSLLTVPTGTLVGVLVAHGERWETVDPGRLHAVVGPVRGRGAQIRFVLSF